MNVEPVGERLPQLRNIGDMGQQTQLDLRIIRRDELVAGAAMKARRIFRPASLRTGMFCRLGSEDESRPVVVAASA